MTIEDIKTELYNTILKDIISYKDETYRNIHNQKIFKNYKNKIFKNVNEIAYLKDNINNLKNLHIFCECGNKNKFINYNIGYRKYCSKKCFTNKLLFKYKNIQPKLFKILNCENCNKEFIANRKQLFKWCNNYEHHKPVYITCCSHCTKVLAQKKIDKNAVKIKRKNTLYQKTGNPNYRNLEKARLTLFEKYGVFHNSQLPNFTKNVKNTKFIKYGDPNYNNKEKIIKTIKERYNVNWNSQTKEWKDSMNINKEHRLQLIYESYKRNNSFKSVSNPELKCYNKLLTKFQDVIHTYRDPIKYPFKCDFYIPSKDLFIECHFGLFHNFKPFDKNNKEHLLELDKLKNIAKQKDLKNKNNRYRGIIYCWTDLDVRKLETFKKNNLNYKIFYTEKEFDDWFEKV